MESVADEDEMDAWDVNIFIAETSLDLTLKINKLNCVLNCYANFFNILTIWKEQKKWQIKEIIFPLMVC